MGLCRKFPFAALVSLTMATAGCSTLPSAGPSAKQVMSEASDDVQAPRYLIADLDQRTVSIVEHTAKPSLFARFGEREEAPSAAIGVGDSVQVTIWEAASGGLFSSAAIGGVTAGSHSASIPDQVVGRDGAITVPYAGRMRRCGRAREAGGSLALSACSGAVV